MKFLSPSEEAAIIASWQQHKDERSITKLVRAFTPLVQREAKKFRRGTVPMDDLMQAGFLGFMKVLDKFDPQNGNRLGAYAQWWIRAEIIEAVLGQTSLIHPGKSPEHKRQFFQGGRKFQFVALDAPLSGAGDIKLADAIPSDAPGPEEIVQTSRDEEFHRGRLRAAIAALPTRAREIIERRWLSESVSTLDALGIEQGVTRERIRQIEQRGIAELKKQMLCASQGLPA